MASDGLFLLRLPLEIRELIYQCLFQADRTPEVPPKEALQNRGSRSVTRQASGIHAEEQWRELADAGFGDGKFMLSSSVDLRDAVVLMQTCRQTHSEVNHFLSSRLIWDMRLRDYSIDKLPVRAWNIRRFRIGIYNTLAFGVSVFPDILQTVESVLGTRADSWVQHSSLYQSLVDLCKLIAERSSADPQHEFESKGSVRRRSGDTQSSQVQTDLVIHIDARMIRESDLVGLIEALRPLQGHVQELRVGALCYLEDNANEMGGFLKTSNHAYHKFRETFGEDVDWVFPNRQAQYKD